MRGMELQEQRAEMEAWAALAAQSLDDSGGEVMQRSSRVLWCVMVAPGAKQREDAAKCRALASRATVCHHLRASDGWSRAPTRTTGIDGALTATDPGARASYLICSSTASSRQRPIFIARGTVQLPAASAQGVPHGHPACASPPRSTGGNDSGDRRSIAFRPCRRSSRPVV